MSETKWTPGPWRAFRNNSFWEVQAMPNEDGTFSDYAPSVAFAWNVEENTDKANAHLIASAPSLYSELDELVKYCQGVIDGEHEMDENCLIHAPRCPRQSLTIYRGA